MINNTGRISKTKSICRHDRDTDEPRMLK
ncbi:hypothetical protein P4284_17655 [Bacillus swezeyi]|nr:hypothetical protein [Bacillus swezeyi]MED2944014.1 hypothetical protein [Bacillus swezeyi]MED2978515.1 hypothetical protein [Bacillus swezeyi]